jgi:hypothetical protein
MPYLSCAWRPGAVVLTTGCMVAALRNIEVRGDLMAGVSDEELEAAASAIMHAAMTFPSAPTVSVVVLCYGNEYPAENLNSATSLHASETHETEEP